MNVRVVVNRVRGSFLFLPGLFVLGAVGLSFRVVTRIRLARALAARAAPGDRERAVEALDAALAEADAIGFGMPLLAEGRVRSGLGAGAGPA